MFLCNIFPGLKWTKGLSVSHSDLEPEQNDD